MAVTDDQLDWVEIVTTQKYVVDVVAQTWDNPHFKISCKDYEPKVSKHGTVYCPNKDCNATVGSLNDISDAFCPRCECPVTAHHYDEGHCLMCGKQCRLRIAPAERRREEEEDEVPETDAPASA